MSDKDGGSAFPLALEMVERQDQDGHRVMCVEMQSNGMSLRDYFAANAPAPVFDIDGWTADECSKELGVDYNYRAHYRILMAKLAYEYADAMLSERTK